MSFQQIAKALEKEVKKGYGKACKDFAIGCCCACQMFLALNIVKDAAANEVWWAKRKKKWSKIDKKNHKK